MSACRASRLRSRALSARRPRKKNETSARAPRSCAPGSGRIIRHWKTIYRFSDCPNCPRRTNWLGVERVLRPFDIIMIAAMLVAATVTYTIKYDAEKQIAVILKLKRQIDSEKDTITLRAESGSKS